MAQKSIRANQVPEGGAIQTNGRGMGGQATKLDVLKSKALTEAFMEASEYNEVTQGSTPLSQGQSTTIQLRNVGFLQKTNLNFEMTFKFTRPAGTLGTIAVADDFPYCIIPRITSQLNGATVLHSGTSAELVAIYDKKYSGEFIYQNHATLGQQINFIGNDSLNEGFLESAGVNTNRMDMTAGVNLASSRVGANVIASATAGNPMNIVSIKANSGATGVVSYDLTVRFTVPIEYTMARDNLVGILPLQNNSIYHEIRIDHVNQLINTIGNAPFMSTDAQTVCELVSASVVPTNCFWAVPLPNDTRLYQYFISFNYINQSQSTITTGAGQSGFNFNLKNNSYLMSTLFTFRDSENKTLIPPMDAVTNIFMDYNGTAQVLNIPINNEFRDLRYRFNGKLPTKFGEYLKDFANADRLENNHVWAKFVDLYQANSPRFVGDTIEPNMTVNIMQEYLAPVLTQQIM